MNRPEPEPRGGARSGGRRGHVAGIDARLALPTVLGGWIGPGYGLPSAAGQAAARLVAPAEGVFLDPVFGAKAMAALIAECRSGRACGTQVFLVSGGALTQFAGFPEVAP